MKGKELLKPESFLKHFDKDRAAYYFEEENNLLIALRAKEGVSQSEVLGKILALLVSNFDFICDHHEKIIIVCYTGQKEEKKNTGMMIEVNDLKLFQKKIIDIDALTERAKYVQGLDLSSISHLLSERQK